MDDCKKWPIHISGISLSVIDMPYEMSKIGLKSTEAKLSAMRGVISRRRHEAVYQSGAVFLSAGQNGTKHMKKISDLCINGIPGKMGVKDQDRQRRFSWKPTA